MMNGTANIPSLSATAHRDRAWDRRIVGNSSNVQVYIPQKAMQTENLANIDIVRFNVNLYDKCFGTKAIDPMRSPDTNRPPKFVFFRPILLEKYVEAQYDGRSAIEDNAKATYIFPPRFDDCKAIE